MSVTEMFSLRRQTALETKILASLSASKLWPRFGVSKMRAEIKKTNKLFDYLYLVVKLDAAPEQLHRYNLSHKQ